MSFLTDFPDLPSLSDPTNFNSQMLAYLAWLVNDSTSSGFAYQINNMTYYDDDEATTGFTFRLADGQQLCWIRKKCDYTNVSYCAGTWVFGAEFSDVPTVVASLETSSVVNATPSVPELSACGAASINTSFCSLQCFRVSGLTDFQASDYVYVHGLALGRYEE